MAKRSNQPGKGVKSLRLDERVKAAADELFEVCEGVVIVAVAGSGTTDSDERVFRSIRGTRLSVSKSLDHLYRGDVSKPEIVLDDHIEDDK